MSHVALSSARSPSKPSLVADSFSKSVVLIGCLIVLQRGIGFLRSFYVCGALSPAEVGQWDLAFSFLAMVAPLAVFGIPGSFGRYVARYEMSGQQGRFLNQTLAACLGLTLLASILIWIFRGGVARYFFGDPAHSELVTLLALGLPLVVFFNFATSWFTGKRLNKVVFRIQFAQTLFFAVLCVVTFQMLSLTAEAVIVAYFVSCLAGVCLAAGYAFIEGSPEWPREKTGVALSVWRKILPFAVWVWISNTLMNLFSVCDRLLLVNFLPSQHADIQDLIGQYHTACIFPSLLMTLGAMAGSMGIPYLSKDWEAGRHESVVERMNLMLKAIGLLCISASIGILLVAPLLFGGIWKDKFATGETLLPMTLSYCSLAAMTFVAQKYFWCIEKTRFSTSVLLVGLVANFSIGLMLVGPFGLEGVVASTLLAHAVVLTGVLFLCNRHGMRVEPGVLIIGIALLTICLGKWMACMSFAAIVVAASCTETVFNDSVKRAAILRFRSFCMLSRGNIS